MKSLGIEIPKASRNPNNLCAHTHTHTPRRGSVTLKEPKMPQVAIWPGQGRHSQLTDNTPNPLCGSLLRYLRQAPGGKDLSCPYPGRPQCGHCSAPPPPTNLRDQLCQLQQEGCYSNRSPSLSPRAHTYSPQ